jgi:hypothetical protein
MARNLCGVPGHSALGFVLLFLGLASLAQISIWCLCWWALGALRVLDRAVVGC